MLKIARKFYYKLVNYKKTRYIQELIDDGMNFGKNISIVDKFFFDKAHCYLITIGDNTTFAPNVSLIAHDASTKYHLGYTKFAKINIGRNCFLGHSVIVLAGVTIGDDSIIGAGSVVTKSIPARSVAAGNPAKVICSLDEYLAKIKEARGDKKIFDSSYHIQYLTREKRAELLEYADKGQGYIV
jgi:maltose O-acetyltransferase